MEWYETWTQGLDAGTLLILLAGATVAAVIFFVRTLRNAAKCDALEKALVREREKTKIEKPAYKVVVYQTKTGNWLSKVMDAKTDRTLYIKTFGGPGKEARTREEAIDRARHLLINGAGLEIEIGTAD